MATSLEELLAEEGFRGRRSLMRSRASYRAEAASVPLYPFRNQTKTDSSSSASVQRLKTERTSSDVNRYVLKGELEASSSSSSRRPRDNLVRKERKDGTAKTDGHAGSNAIHEYRARNVDGLEKNKGSEIVEVGEEEEERVKDIYSVKAYNSEKSERSFKGHGEKERHRETKGKDIKVDKRHNGNSNKNLQKYREVSDDKRKSMKEPGRSYESSVRGSKNAKTFEDQRALRESVPPTVSKLALDEVAVKALVSILSGYSKRFLMDGEFRIALRSSCFSSLNLIERDECKVKTNLEQAINIVEKAAEEAASTREVKKALSQLGVIAELDSKDLKDGYTSGIPNSSLSACAHLYLSVIRKLQKKDRVSAEHILQVFYDSPFVARTMLLPELWDYLFFPLLSHLNDWYTQEANSLLNTPSKAMKLKHLDKVYNEILDSGTCQFAVYYKKWLTEGLEAPSTPSIHIPSVSVGEVPYGDSCDHSSVRGSPSGPFSPQPMVSKKLYDAVFGRSTKPGAYEVEDGGEVTNFDNGASSSDGSAVVVKYALPHSSEKDSGKVSSSKEEWQLVNVITLPETDPKNEINNSGIWEKTVGDSYMLKASSPAKANELTLKSLAKSVFEMQQTEDSRDSPVYALPHSSMQSKVRDSHEELCHGLIDEGSIFSSIPQEFICPLTGQLFEDPVTLETGQTFERAAIREWFNQGHKTCPVTGKNLECLNAPLTNFILKRLIDGWKLEHCSHLLAFASQVFRNCGECESSQWDEKVTVILEKFLTTFSKEESLTNARHIISLGGVEFLIKRFEFGHLEEKARVAALFCCCIEADAGCRYKIACKINKTCLFKLLHSTQTKARSNAVFLFTELVCLRRRNDVALFLSSWQQDEILNTMRVLLVYLQSCPPEQRPMVAILLLHLDLLVETQKYSTYRQEAVDAISVAVESSLTDKKVQENACRALLILGGRFSASGKLLTESWILKQAGFNNNCEVNSVEDNLLLYDSISPEEEEASEEWLRNVSASLVGGGKKSFLETISKCLGSGILDLVRVCLVTIAWLSGALCSLSDKEFQLSAFSALISELKEILENDEQIEHRILVSISLLNFSTIPECRVLLMTAAEEITAPLQSLAEVTWTAKQLYGIIQGDH